MGLAERSELADPPVQRVVGVEVGVGRRRRRADQIVVVVRRDLGREHVLAGVLIAAVADETLLVPVVDDGLAAADVHQGMGQAVALQQLVAARPAVAEEQPDAAHVVVAEERRQRVGVGVAVGVVVVAREEVAQLRRRAPVGEAGRAGLEPEVERRLQPAFRRVPGHERRVGVEHLAEREEVVVAVERSALLDGVRELLPELDVDVLRGVDPEAVDAEVHPRPVDLAHPVDDGRLLGEQVVEADEVAVLAGLSGERRVAAVVVVARVVEPVRDLDGRIGGCAEHRGVGERRGRVELGERRSAGEVAIVELVAGCVEVGRGGLVDVGVLAFVVVDDVGRVVRDDVEEHLDAAGVGRVDQVLELLVRPEVGVDLGEVGDPVAVVRGAGVRTRALHRLVLERRREPDGGRAEAGDVVELGRHTGDVTAVVEALVRRVEPGDQRAAGEVPAVVGRIAVGEAVGHHEVEALACQVLAQGRTGELLVGRSQRLRVGGRSHCDAVGGVVVGEREPDRCGQHQGDVGGWVAARPPAVERDLPLERAGGDGGRERPHAVRAPRQRRGRTCRVPVPAAAELGLQRPGQGRARGRRLVVGRDPRRGPDDGDRRDGEHERQCHPLAHPCDGSHRDPLQPSRRSRPPTSRRPGGIMPPRRGAGARAVQPSVARCGRPAAPVTITLAMATTRHPRGAHDHPMSTSTQRGDERGTRG